MAFADKIRRLAGSAPRNPVHGYGCGMDTTKNTTIVVSHETALRLVRVARRRYAHLPWMPLTTAEQQRVLAACSPNQTNLDMSALYRAGLRDHGSEGYRIDMLIPEKRIGHASKHVRCHVLSSPLPSGSIYEVKPGIYTVAPTVMAAQLTQTRTFPEMMILLEELCGTFSFHEDQARESSANETLAPDYESETSRYYEADPVTTALELQRQLERLKGIRGRKTALTAARHLLDGARSPGEAIRACLFHLPCSYGGFNVKDMVLNYKIDFTEEARAASRMPYAILDAFIRLARACLEYNGSYHELINARLHDDRRDAGLEAMGITTLVINREQLRDIDALEAIARILYRRAGKRYRNRTEGHRVKQVELLNGLRRACGWPAC